MKNTQKILLAIFAFVLVAVTVIVIVIKSDHNSDNTTQPDNDTLYTLPEESIDTTQTENEANTSQHSDHNHNNTPVTSDDIVSPSENKNNISSDENNDVQSSKTYDLSDAEILQTQKSSFGNISLISTKNYGKRVYLIEASVENKKFFYEFPSSYNIENIYYANVDGEYGDELIIHADIDYTGIYDNVVLKITKNGIKSLINKNQLIDFMSCNSSVLKNNFNVEITNSYTGMRKTINVQGINNEDYSDSYWEKDGTIAETDPKDHVWFEESYYVFEPRDTDNDGIYEIVCCQQASLGSPDSLIGYVETVLEFNSKTKKFEISKTNFYSM